MCFYHKNKTCGAAMSADGDLRNWLQDFLQKTGQTRLFTQYLMSIKEKQTNFSEVRLVLTLKGIFPKGPHRVYAVI